MTERSDGNSWRIFLWVVIVSAVLWFLYTVRGVLFPFVLAWLIAVLLEPVVKLLVGKRVPRGIAVGMLALVFFGAIGALVVVIAPKVSNQMNEVRLQVQKTSDSMAEESLNDNVYRRWNPVVQARPPGTLGSVDVWLEKNRSLLDQFGLPSTRRAINQQYIQPHREDISKGLTSAFNGFVTFLGSAASQLVLFAFTPLFTIVLMQDLNGFRKRFRHWVPPSIRLQTMEFLDEVGDVLQGYLRGVTINLATYTVVQAIVLSVLGVPYSYLFAIAAGTLYIIPTLGGLISGISLTLITLISGATGPAWMGISNPLVYVAIVFVAFTVITSTWDMVITPRVVGGAVKLHPFVGMFVVFSGGALFGFVGMMLSYPVAGVVKVCLERLLAITNQQARQKLDLPAVPLRHRDEGAI